MGAGRSLLGLLIRACLLLSLLFVVTAWWLLRDMEDYLQSPLREGTEDILYRIAPGSSFAQVLSELHARGIVRHPGYLHLAAWYRGQTTQIQAGEYLIRPAMTPLDMLGLFASGKVTRYSLTLIEGWRFADVMHAVKTHPALRQTLSDHLQQTVLAVLEAQDHTSAEGLFLAETWHFHQGTTDVDFLRRAHGDLLVLLERMWHERQPGLPYRSSYEALIMASLVEKETALESERGRIAGVFVRRLQQGMRLQTDPTVIFALGDAYDGNIRKQDLRIDSPYNTYRYRGLPPGPICLVGAMALRAALRPQAGDSLYFVARKDGSHHFSATLSEHNRAVRKYQLKR